MNPEDDDFRYSHTRYGFTWGPVEVMRAASDRRHGVWIILRTEKEEIQIRATNTGLIRVGEVEKLARKAKS